MSDERVLSRARVAWRAAIDRDDAAAAEDRVARLLRYGHARPPRPAVPLPIFACALVVIAAVSLVRRDERPTESAAVESYASNAIERPTVAAGETRGDAREQGPLRVTSPCFDCRRAGEALASDDRLAPGDHVQVPAGAVLLLCWGVDARFEVEGPADVTVGATGEPLVRAAGPIARRENAAQTSEPSLDARQSVLAEWRQAQAALREGDRAGAERRLRSLVGRRDAPATLVERASFSLAELELARGAASEARDRLGRLESSRDAALAADAVFLDARAATSAADRAGVYARYLALGPPSPYREQALVEQGLALLQSGDVPGARRCVRTLRAQPAVPGVVMPALLRLEHALEHP